MKIYIQFIILLAFLTGCASRPELKNVKARAEEKPINTAAQIQKITAQHE